jgi:hypothetical protein
MGLGGHARMETEPGNLAYRIRETLRWIDGR